MLSVSDLHTEYWIFSSLTVVMIVLEIHAHNEKEIPPSDQEYTHVCSAIMQAQGSPSLFPS